MKIILSEEMKKTALDSARHVADWIVENQVIDSDMNADAGNSVFVIDKDGKRYNANNWNLAFATMGLLAAAETFGDERYESAARTMIRYLKGFQIFSPFLPQHYGAIREMSPLTPWCYVRDALSAAWGFLEFYRHTGEEEYLKRAILWGEWFLKNGLDETQWPYWGVQFEPYSAHTTPQMCNDMHGCFHGGGLNFFYQLAKTTGDRKWVTGFYEHMADYFAANIQQQDGFFRTIEKATGKVPANDPQNGLHRANDDLGTLGLLGAYRLTGRKIYLETIEKFLTAVFQRQREDGQFEDSCAAVPVVLNVLHELGDDSAFTPPEGAVEKALQGLFSRQYPESAPLYHRGGFNETGDGDVCARSTCYALIVLQKLAGGKDRYLTC